MSLFDGDLIKKEPILSFLDKFGCDLKHHLENNHNSYVFSYHTHGRRAVIKAISILIRTLKEREKYNRHISIFGKAATITAPGQYNPDTYVTEIGDELYIKIKVAPLMFVPSKATGHDDDGEIIIILDRNFNIRHFKILHFDYSNIGLF